MPSCKVRADAPRDAARVALSTSARVLDPTQWPLWIGRLGHPRPARALWRGSAELAACGRRRRRPRVHGGNVSTRKRGVVDNAPPRHPVRIDVAAVAVPHRAAPEKHHCEGQQCHKRKHVAAHSSRSWSPVAHNGREFLAPHWLEVWCLGSVFSCKLACPRSATHPALATPCMHADAMPVRGGESLQLAHDHDANLQLRVERPCIGQRLQDGCGQWAQWKLVCHRVSALAPSATPKPFATMIYPARGLLCECSVSVGATVTYGCVHASLRRSCNA